MNAESLAADVWRIIDKANLGQSEYVEFLYDLQSDAQDRINAAEYDLGNNSN